ADGAALLEAPRNPDDRAVGAALRRAGLADPLGDGVRELLVPRVEVDVVGDEELSRADHRRPGLRVELRGPEVGGERRVLELLRKRLVLPLSDVGEGSPLRARRRGLIEVDRNAQLLADTLAESAGDGDAVLHGRPFHGDERADVGGAEPRVLT